MRGMLVNRWRFRQLPYGKVNSDSESREVSEKRNEHPRTHLLLVLAALFPAVVAFGILYKQELSVPYQDDYKSILAFASNFEQFPTITAKLLFIATDQFNEYRLGFGHSIVASEIGLTRHLNFRFLTALGDLFLLPIGYLLWRTCPWSDRGRNRRLLEFVPISFLFFSLTYWESLNWAMAGLQNIPVVFFSFLAIFLLVPRDLLRPTWAHLLFGCLAAVLAAFSSANGFLLGPVGLLILIPRRAYTQSLAWCASFALPVAAYLYHYHPYHPWGSSIHTFPLFLSRPFYFLAFLGCVVPNRLPAALLGLVVLVIFLHALRCRFDRTNPVASYFAIWIMGTALLVAWARGGIASRYSIYSSLLLIFCYLFLAQNLPTFSPALDRRRLYIVSAVLAVGLCFFADVRAYKQLGMRRRMVLSGIELYRANPEANSPMIDPAVEKIAPEEGALEQSILTRAIQEQLWTLPPKLNAR